MTVYLVGAGPGDPGLLTIRGAELLRRADVVVHDRLAESSLLELAPPEAERVDVGKSPGSSGGQEAINALLVERGAAGKVVVRLKGGDPFVFGRGGEEAMALAEAGIDYEIVPGVTSAVAVPAYAGVPVTHRGLSTSFTVVTGHSRFEVDGETNWEALAAVGGTLVVLMGVAHRGEIARRLIGGGLAPDTPVIAVTWGTRPDQVTTRTTLRGLGDAEIEPPATIVVGPVARMQLDWWVKRPLFGLRVVVTRARAQASTLSARLGALGAQAVEVPAIEIGPPADGGAGLRAAAKDLEAGRFQWVVFTSSNAVQRFLPLLRDSRDFRDARIATIGPGTAEALARFNLQPDLMPGRYVAEDLLAAFPEAPATGVVLLPRAAAAREVLPDGLAAKGWTVEVVEAYRTVNPAVDESVLAAAEGADAICFTASSTVTGFLKVAGLARLPPVVAAIGPITAQTAVDAGLHVDIVAEDHTIDGLVAALVQWSQQTRPSS